MSVSPVSSEPNASSTYSLDVLVARLRAAGCVFAQDEAALLLAAAGDPAELDQMAGRRAAGTPLEHVLGWAEFCGQRIVVEDGVFVPRHRTEFLVDLATGLGLASRAARGQASATVVVDLCCGSGALGVVLADRLRSPGVELHAADIDPAAVRCARRNVVPLGGSVYEGDLYAALPPALRGCVDILLANAPYVPTDAIGLLPPEAREHESLVALDGGSDGLAVLQRVIVGAGGWLADGGHLLVEASEAQTPDLVGAVADAGLTVQAVHSQEHDVTVIIATSPSP
jgi:release factor glutamine methyltransferase